jgi:hypothetical protein
MTWKKPSIPRKKHLKFTDEYYLEYDKVNIDKCTKDGWMGVQRAKPKWVKKKNGE